MTRQSVSEVHTGHGSIWVGDVRQVLPLLPASSVQCCVTSPPYFGLRNYGVDGQIGLEPTPEAYVAQIVEVFREVRRVLREDGTLWLNLGDSYANDGKWGGSSGGKHVTSLHGNTGIGRGRKSTGLKPKDLIGIPWRVAFALQADGWYLRQDIIWHKPNPMPESVRDRCTKAHEYLFLLTKSERYYFDADAIREPSQNKDPRSSRAPKDVSKGAVRSSELATLGLTRGRTNESCTHPLGRNKRSVWTITPKPFRGAHFATFPPDLVEPCILAGSRPGDLVLDPFGGSGTTGQVAIQHGRYPLLVELNPEYVALIYTRLDANTTQGEQIA